MRYSQHLLSGTVATFAGVFAALSALPAAAAAPPPIPNHCREFSEMVKIDGAHQRVHGMVCRRADGSWQVVPTPLMKAPLNTPYAPMTTESASAAPAGASNAAAYFWFPSDMSVPRSCSAMVPPGSGLGAPAFFPNASIINRSVMMTTNVFGFPFGPTVVAVAPPAFALVNPRGGGGPHHH